MRRAACLLIFLTICAAAVKAQRTGDDGIRQPRILLVLDASSSMLQPWNTTIRFKAAAKVIAALMDSIYSVNAGVEFGLRVYGHQSPAQNNDCFDSKQEVMFSKNNATQMGLRLASLKPFGVSPIAYSLKEAAENDLVDEVRNAYSVILITDGGESCGGNICDVVKTLIERKIYFRPYILSLVEYAPLKDQYACLGAYLQVAREEDIAPAINRIVDAYRPMLSMPIMAIKAEPGAPKRAVTVVNIPAWIPDRSSVASLSISITKSEGQPVYHVNHPAPHRMPVPRPASVSKPAPEPVIAPPVVKRDTVAIVRHDAVAIVRRDAVAAVSSIAGRNELQIYHSGPVAPRRMPVPRPSPVSKPPPEPVVTAPVIKHDTVAAIKPVITSRVPTRDTMRSATIIKRIEMPVPVVPKRKPGTAPPDSNRPKEMEFTSQTEDATETSLAILFTDGHGKFYASTPQLQLKDAVSGKLVKEFYRTVDPAGNPDPLTIPAGTYNLLVVGRSNMLMRHIVVEKNKKNRVIVRVSNGSLRFRYEDAPDRPVEEFDAIVNIRFEPGPTVKQRCTAELEYAPGNYYIEINTVPVLRYNTDIDFGAITEIQIPQPGYVQFINTTPVGTISLYTPLGNKFVRFHGLRITGNPGDQRLRLNPGTYEVHWVKNPSAPFATETIERFVVKSNSVTEMELR